MKAYKGKGINCAHRFESRARTGHFGYQMFSLDHMYTPGTFFGICGLFGEGVGWDGTVLSHRH